MDLHDMKRVAEAEIMRYRENVAFINGQRDGGGDTAIWRDRQRWVWAVDRIRMLLEKTNPEKALFFVKLYRLDEPHGRIRVRESLVRLTLELHITSATLYRWREELLLSVAIAAVQTQALRPF